VRFTILSHAGLLIEHGGVSVVCDPWLIGSCYWRSWWNFPEPPPELIENLSADFIYLTHLHWDHFHGPSLQKLFSRDTTILVPKATTTRMVDDLEDLGFHKVIEIPHGKRFRLGEDFELCSYQFGVGVDSAAVITGGGTTLFNCNDCKLFGMPLQQVLNDHPKIDFIFRSHSSASPVPWCIENYEGILAADDGSYNQADQFARCALYTKARYAIPFASNHCFLHPETTEFNATATTPDLARERYNQLATQTGARTECVVMTPGSSWSTHHGFHIVPFDFSHRMEHVKELQARHAETIEARLKLEASTRAHFPAFKRYFQKFFKALPWFLKNGKLPPLLFRVTDRDGVRHWLVDPKAGTVAEVADPPEDVSRISLHGSVLNDCVGKKMFSAWTPSKRLRIRLPSPDALKGVNLWFQLLDCFEIDMLPITNNFSARSLAVRVRRWREVAEVAAIVTRKVLMRRPFTVSQIYPLRAIRS
jgi:UDP-MurNAc hydroxylase